MSSWHSNFTTQYLKLMKRYEANVILSVGGHALRANLRVPESSQVRDLNHIFFGAPSVSPLGSSNPGFSIIQLANKSASLPSA